MTEPSKAPEPFLKPYNSAENEPKILELWEKSGFANPDVCIEKGVTAPDAESYSIVLPPPNVTGTLHMGHAAMLAIQDILIRYHRMRGEKTLWLPGTDHAAIATQSVVEKNLLKTEKKSRHDLGREEFLKRVEEFAQASHDTIVGQVRAMGASVDWTREAYTLDEARNVAVRTAFKNMYDAGLIYRGNRIVNWDPKMQTTVSDDEIEYVEQKDPFYYFKYGPFTIGTVRPETKFGDKYIVMHPDDARYKEYKHGQQLEVEWINGPILATIIKDQAADMSFGSGVMTITPAHSGIDFEIAQKHKLDVEQIINERGILLPIAGEFAGQHIKKARPMVLEKLRAKGLLVKIEEGYVHNVATNSRGGETLEPQIKLQWFVDVNKKFTIPHSEIPGIASGSKTSLKEIMRRAVDSGAIKIAPDRFEKVYYNWIDNLRDWCISRQIWYGHRIPVWYCLNCKYEAVDADVKSKWFLVRHGETEGNVKRITQGHQDTPLTEQGIAQARTAGEQLKNQNIELIISSDLGRCKQTAEIIAKATGAEVVFDAAFRERFMGDGEGLTYEEQEERFSPFKDYDDRTEGNMETTRELEERVSEAFAKHKKIHGHKNVVIVSHGGAIRWLLKRIKNLTFDEARITKVAGNASVQSLDVLNACTKCGNDLFEQDSDTLDTWFSSGLWTFSTLGWPLDYAQGKPKTGTDLATYHPTAVLETGYDILFFWVARMILMTGFCLGTVPFRNVYLHGLVRDAKGRKMSKSLGNVIDPLTMTEKYGADAARLSLIVGASPGNDVKLSEDRVRGYKHFANKVWNISRFVLESCADLHTKADAEIGHGVSNLEEADNQLIAETQEIASVVSEHIDNFRLDLAADTIYHFVWHRFADEIIEDSKTILKGADEAAALSRRYTLNAILDTSLRLLHPFMPFVTEAIWQNLPAHAGGQAGLPQKDSELLMVAKWPSYNS
ncbi:MAG: class I tRNA ligase family protein [bacterium]|nr:class I tRNA ligase family protein [bacterium]